MFQVSFDRKSVVLISLSQHVTLSMLANINTSIVKVKTNSEMTIIKRKDFSWQVLPQELH